MGNIFSGQPSNTEKNEDHLKFLAALASSLRLGWLGSVEKKWEIKLCQRSLFPMLLNECAAKGDIIGLQTLVQQGADVLVSDSRGRTPLHLAACGGDVETVNYLISKGCDVNAVDLSGRSPLTDAIHCNNIEAVTVLVKEGAELDTSATELAAQMCCLAYEGDTKLLEAWRKAGVSLNLADKDGRTPLHVAVCSNQEDVVKYCLKHGSSVERRDRFNNRPVDDAHRLGLKHIARRLASKAK